MNVNDLTGLGTVADLAKTVIGKIWPDKSEQERQELAAAVLVVQGQLAVNTAEASNPSVFVSGWRPFVGWTCGAGFAVQFVVGPLATWSAALMGRAVAFPQMDLGTMMPVLLGMLGLAGFRSWEKAQGVAAK